MNWNDFQLEYTKWAMSVFTHATISSKLAHLRSELDEIEKKPEDIEEWADVMLLYLGAAQLAGHSIGNIFLAAQKKAEKNKKRKWGNPNKEGYVEHVREDSE